MNIYRAIEPDIAGIITLKDELRFQETTRSTNGGFLLGTDSSGYRKRLDSTWVLKDGKTGEVEGFAIVLSEAAFRSSEVWARRNLVRWEGVQLAEVESRKLCFFDQLAIRRGNFRLKKWGPALALRAVLNQLDRGHEYLITTTVAKPVQNLSAVPFIQRIGGERVGRLKEVYEEIGALVSDVWIAPRRRIIERINNPVGLAERWVCDAANGQTPLKLPKSRGGFSDSDLGGGLNHRRSQD